MTEQIMYGLQSLLMRNSGRLLLFRRGLWFEIVAVISCRMPSIKWCPICAAWAPVVARLRLCIAVRAFTCFLWFLSKEVTGSVLHQLIQGFAGWIEDLDGWGFTVLGEADCKDQFNRILLSDVLKHFDEATEWLRS